MIGLFIGNKGLFLPSKLHLNMHYDFFFAVLLLLRDKKDNSETQKKKYSAILPFLRSTDGNVKSWWIKSFCLCLYACVAIISSSESVILLHTINFCPRWNITTAKFVSTTSKNEKRYFIFKAMSWNQCYK